MPIFVEWSSMDLYNLYPEQEFRFLKWKESQYEERRENVNKICQRLQNQKASLAHKSMLSKECHLGSKIWELKNAFLEKFNFPINNFREAKLLRFDRQKAQAWILQGSQSC